MDLTIYNVIKGPVLSDKAYKINQNLKKLVLNVHPAANKPMVAEAIEKLFDVKVDNVRIMVRKGKNRMVGRRPVTGKTVKRAIVTLKEGYSLDIFNAPNIGLNSVESKSNDSQQG
ncbi:MAG: 50S ribosomal protein L23 [candidate division TM6 bacterium GW2011_GWF2_32_72]|nr:MAG: 50S ribosomal protein L23 [candidate division TM6 bacterium GW2011_GWF2_32_72]